jgi:hypothetical protein
MILLLRNTLTLCLGISMTPGNKLPFNKWGSAVNLFVVVFVKGAPVINSKRHAKAIHKPIFLITSLHHYHKVATVE